MLCRFLMPVLTLAVTASAFAAEEGHGHEGGHGGEHHQPGLLDIDVGTSVWTFILFVILLVFLGKFVWPKIVAGLDAREQKIRGDIEQAQAANQKAAQTLAEYEKKLEEAHAEARGLIDQARADAETFRKRLESEAETDIAKQRQRATDEIDQAKQAAVQEMYAKAGELAVAVAGKLLSREIDASDTQKLIDESLSELDQLGSAG